jgi:hypothetical protein
MGTSKTSKHYASNPKSRAKRQAAQKKINARPSEKKRRRELAAERRKRGIMGKGGKDVSHKKDGSTTLENRSKNRARNGSGGKARRK